MASTGSLEQEEMDNAVAVLTEAAAQGHMDAQMNLGHIYGSGRGVAKDVGCLVDCGVEEDSLVRHGLCQFLGHQCFDL